MLRKKAVIASLCLISTIVSPLWGKEAQAAAAGKWDLWGDSGEPALSGAGEAEAPAVDHSADKAGTTTDYSATNETRADESLPAAGAAPYVDHAAAVPDSAGVDAGFPAALGADYLIGSGDLLDISVWKDETLSRTAFVLPDGTVALPLVGKLRVAGRTVTQVRDDLVRKLESYIPEPEITVDVKQSNSMMVYVLGRVNAPGRQVLNTNVDVLQALAMAGGLNPFANRNKIKIFRKDGEQTTVLPFRYSDVIDGKTSTNIVLKRGDVIVVP